MLKILLENSADANALNNEGKSPLLLCVEAGNVQGVKLLLEKNVAPTQAVRDAAQQRGNKEIEKLLNGNQEK